jgi:hypothetical protein
MAFAAENLKTRLADWLRTWEGDVAVYVEQIIGATHGAVDSVHAQAVADEQTPHQQQVGGVRTVESRASGNAADLRNPPPFGDAAGEAGAVPAAPGSPTAGAPVVETTRVYQGPRAAKQ